MFGETSHNFLTPGEADHVIATRVAVDALRRRPRTDTGRETREIIQRFAGEGFTEADILTDLAQKANPDYKSPFDQIAEHLDITDEPQS